ncbi:hypothetical protein AB6A40_009476 [Gnathostoma spinigerum]|uniref:Solute carrier family 25 member 38 homolog n=1 Tax=Gnathostoma spinigerum TaxID=75299 RepID=A0ABD6EUH2_9BILA
MSDDKRINHVASSVIFGSVSGFVSTVLLQPLDRLKTLSQQDTVHRSNVFKRCQLVINENGVTGLWRGLTPSLLRVVPGVALYFGLYELGRSCLPQNSNVYLSNFALGAISRTLAGSLLMPATVIKTRFESTYYQDRSVLSAARDIVRQNGLKGLFKGIVPTIMRDAPFSGIYLVFYRQNLKLLHEDASKCTPLSRFLSGLCSGICACAVTQPFDITKTHIQLFPNRYSSLARVTLSLFKQGGFLVFFTGFWLRAIRRTLMATLNWTIFDELFEARFHHG